nr:MAG TPA: hypothetical protein [Caudoviricetes sp.]
MCHLLFVFVVYMVIIIYDIATFVNTFFVVLMSFCCFNSILLLIFHL